MSEVKGLTIRLDKVLLEEFGAECPKCKQAGIQPDEKNHCVCPNQECKEEWDWKPTEFDDEDDVFDIDEGGVECPFCHSSQGYVEDGKGYCKKCKEGWDAK